MYTARSKNSFENSFEHAFENAFEQAFEYVICLNIEIISTFPAVFLPFNLLLHYFCVYNSQSTFTGLNASQLVSILDPTPINSLFVESPISAASWFEQRSRTRVPRLHSPQCRTTAILALPVVTTEDPPRLRFHSIAIS